MDPYGHASIVRYSTITRAFAEGSPETRNPTPETPGGSGGGGGFGGLGFGVKGLGFRV